MSPRRKPARTTLPPRDVLLPAVYEAIRPHLLPHFLAAKRWRRLALGQDATLVFENREIVLFHLHERLRAEGVTDARRRADLVAEHERLLPRPYQLRASLFIDGADRRRGALLAQRMTGSRSPISLLVGACRVRGDIVEPMASAVHYITFDLRAATRVLARGAVSLSVGLAFDAGASQTPLDPLTTERLLQDLLASERVAARRHPFQQYTCSNDILNGDFHARETA